MSYAIGVGSVLTLLLAGCGADETPDAPGADGTAAQTQAPETDEVVQTQAPETDEGSASGQMFVDAFEAEGMECDPTDPEMFRSGVVDQFVCQGDDYLVMSIRNYEDAGARDAQLEQIQDLACEIADQGQDIQRVTVSDTWIVMPGGDRDIDFEVFGNAMTGLGLDWEDYTC